MYITKGQKTFTCSRCTAINQKKKINFGFVTFALTLKSLKLNI